MYTDDEEGPVPQSNPLGSFLSGDLLAANEEELSDLGHFLREAGDLLCGGRREILSDLSKRHPLGSRVRIVGLQRQPVFNGRFGRVFKEPGTSSRRFQVALEGPAESSLAVQTQNLVACAESPEKGYVLLHSLRSRPELNGQAARVVAAEEGGGASAAACVGRVTVIAADEQHLSVPIECVLPVAHPNLPVTDLLRGQCCVCLATDCAMTVADPCGHSKVCAECALRFVHRAPCPLCRRPVEKYVEVFL